MDLFKGIRDADGADKEEVTRSAIREPRETTREQREVIYKPPSDLEIPDSVKERFLAKGYKTRWIRYKIGNDIDQSNLFKHTKEHVELVKPEEVPEMAGMTQVNSIGNVENLVTVGDLALGKVPVEWAEARKEYYANQSRHQLGTIRDELMKHNTKMAPVSDESRSSTKVGKNAHFASE